MSDGKGSWVVRAGLLGAPDATCELVETVEGAIVAVLRLVSVDKAKAGEEGDGTVVESAGIAEGVEATVAEGDGAEYQGSSAPVGADGQFAVKVEWVFGSAPGMF